MKDGEKDSTEELPELRRRAELAASEKSSSGVSDLSALSPEEVQQLIHELQVHQIELEMQNEELRQTQLSLEASRNNYSELYDFAPFGYFTFDQNGVILEVNLAGSGLLGVERQLLIGKSLSGFVNEEDGNALYLHFRQVLETESRQTCDVQIMKKNGTEVPVRLESQVLWSRDRLPKVIRTAAIDITKRKQLEEALSASELHYRRLFESAQDGILILDFDTGRILDVNPSLIDMLGYSHDECLGKKLWELGLLQDVAAGRTLFAELQEKGCVRYEGLRLETSQKRSIEVEFVGNAYPVEGKTFIQCNIRDITERKRVEEELNRYRTHLEDIVRERTEELLKRTREIETANVRLREADRLKSIFLASMSHELRTPLNSIIGFTGIMLMGLTGGLSEEQKKQLTMVKDSANHLLGLVEEVLDIAKIEAGGVTLSLENFELGEVVDSVIETVAPLAAEKGLEIVREVPSGLALTSDRRRVTQILMNIIGNAVKFTEHGIVKIIAEVPGDGRLELRFTDTGIGIKEEDMKRLFSPFQQTDATLTKAYEGTGLGLYLSKKLATLLGGDIVVTSTHRKGSEFTVVLPLVYGGAHEKDTGA